PEVNIDGESGYLFDLGDVDSMAKKSINLLKDDEKLESMKDSAYALAKRFDIDAVVNQYIAVYKDALGR
ncbi:MAG: N-acetyl-alpha-D-glucosaminyl L-malate synthase BshA, partial [Candidatus Arcticimaribacter sp.]